MDPIDYSKYSLDELLEVKSNIATDSPNYPALISELENRKPELEAARLAATEESFMLAEHRVKIIGYFQIAAATTILCLYVYQVIGSGFDLLNSLLIFVFVSLNLVAGYTALKEEKKYYWLSIVNQALQIVSFSIGSIVANYSGLGGIYLTLEWSQLFEFGVSAHFSPGFSYQEYTGSTPEQWLAIDALAVVFIGALITVMGGRDTANNDTQAETK